MRKEREGQRRGRREQRKKLTKIASHSVSKHGARTSSYSIPSNRLRKLRPISQVCTCLHISKMVTNISPLFLCIFIIENTRKKKKTRSVLMYLCIRTHTFNILLLGLCPDAIFVFYINKN